MSKNEYIPINSIQQTKNSKTIRSEEPKKNQTAWEWFKEKPLQRWPFLLFILFGVLTVVWILMYLTSSLSGYVLAAVFAMVMSFYGANYFRILLGLKEEVDKMDKLNRDFRAENVALKQEVDKLSRAREQLTNVQQKLQESNVKLKQSLEKFRELDKNLKQLSGGNIQGLEKLQNSCQAVMNRWKESLIKHEKTMLNKVFDEFETNDDKTDMSKSEFELFLNALPPAYKMRWESMKTTFEEIAGDDNMIQYDEFRKLVDRWAEEEALLVKK